MAGAGFVPLTVSHIQNIAIAHRYQIYECDERAAYFTGNMVDFQFAVIVHVSNHWSLVQALVLAPVPKYESS